MKTVICTPLANQNITTLLFIDKIRSINFDLERKEMAVVYDNGDIQSFVLNYDLAHYYGIA